MVWCILHHKEILLSEPGRNRRECILSRTPPLLFMLWYYVLIFCIFSCFWFSHYTYRFALFVLLLLSLCVLVWFVFVLYCIILEISSTPSFAYSFELILFPIPSGTSVFLVLCVTTIKIIPELIMVNVQKEKGRIWPSCMT